MNMDAMGIIGMIFGMAALYRVQKLEKELKEKGMTYKNLNINNKN
jgi:hypothetical protein